MNALVTGGAGFIGSHIVDKLVEKGSDVRVLKSGFRSNKHPNLVNKNATTIEGTLLDYYDMLKATRGVDMVFHCGAVLSHYADLYPELMFDVNIKGMWNLKRACQYNGVKRIIFASTSFVYGDPVNVPVDEDDSLRPKGNFEVSKLAGEKILQATYPYLVPYTILRLFNVYGPRSYPDGVYSQATTTFILKALNKENIEVHDNGKQRLDFVYVKDVAQAFCDCVSDQAENRIFNVGSGVAKSVIDLAKTVNEFTGNPIDNVHYNVAHPAYLHTVQANIESIRIAVGWTPKTPWVEGLKETIEFFKEWKY